LPRASRILPRTLAKKPSNVILVTDVSIGARGRWDGPVRRPPPLPAHQLPPLAVPPHPAPGRHEAVPNPNRQSRLVARTALWTLVAGLSLLIYLLAWQLINEELAADAHPGPERPAVVMALE
jgi:hypothetical protein